MKILLVTDVFGRMPYLNSLIQHWQNAGAEVECVEPYQHPQHTFSSDAEAYATFTQECGHDEYANRVLSVIQSKPAPDVVVGFSAGAAAAWRALSNTEGEVKHFIAFYPNQLRHYVDLPCRQACTLIWPAFEDHFDLSDVKHQLADRRAVNQMTLDAQHGFMNPHSAGFDANLSALVLKPLTDLSVLASQPACLQRMQRVAGDSNEIKIRPMRKGEESRLRQIFHHAIHHGASAYYSQAQCQAWAPDEYDHGQWCARMQKITPQVVSLGNEIVAYSDVQDDGYIDHFFCHARFHGHGLGRRLFSHLLNQAKSRNLPRMYTHASAAARAFFEKMGFSLINPQEVEIRGQTLNNFVMERKL